MWVLIRKLEIALNISKIIYQLRKYRYKVLTRKNEKSL